MGTIFSRNRGENNANQLALDHLTTNAYHQSVIRSLYMSNQHNLAHPGAFIISEGGEPGARNITIKKSKPMKNQFQIDKTSVRLIPATEKSSTFSLSFVFSCKIDCRMTLYLLATESIDTNHLTEAIATGDKEGPPRFFSFSQGEKQKFHFEDYMINTSLYEQEQLCSHKDNNYPLIILMEPESPLDEVKQKLYVYFTFVRIETGYNIKIVRQKLQYPHRAYILDAIYGIGESGLAHNPDMDDKNCSVCLAAKIDTIVLPCKHMCFCYNCAKDFKKHFDHRCPMCRRSNPFLRNAD